MALDSRVNPELLAHLTRTLNRSRILAARTIVHRAVERGELDPGTSVTLLLEIVTGAVLSHALFGLSDPAPDDDDAYADRIVEVVVGALHGAGSVSDPKRKSQSVIEL